MRKIDEAKLNSEKAAKTISFDKFVLKQLERRAKQSSLTVSKLTNIIIKQKIFTDAEFYKELSKFHYLKFQEYQFLKEQNQIIIQTKD